MKKRMLFYLVPSLLVVLFGAGCNSSPSLSTNGNSLAKTTTTNQKEAVTAPAIIPKELLFPNGTVTYRFDQSNASHVDAAVHLEANKDKQTIVDYYKNILTHGNWQLLDQRTSTDPEEVYLYGKDKKNLKAEVDIVAKPFETDQWNILITYSGWLK